MKTPFDKFEDKLTFSANPDKKRLILMQTDRFKDKSSFNAS